jgi:hypothetical protein
MTRWQSVLLISVVLALNGCGHQKTIGYGMAIVGGLGVVGAGLGALGCTSSSTQCTSRDAAILASTALGGATVAGVGLAIASLTAKPEADPEPPAAAGKPVDPSAPDPNDAPRHEEDLRFGGEKPAPRE